MLEKFRGGVCQMSYDASEGGKLKTSEYRQKGGFKITKKKRHMIFEQPLKAVAFHVHSTSAYCISYDLSEIWWD